MDFCRTIESQYFRRLVRPKYVTAWLIEMKISIVLLSTLLLYIKDSNCVKQTPASELEQNVHQCVHYSRKVSKLVTEQDLVCLQCDPTVAACDPACQPALNFQYAACHGVCLPDGFFFDYSKISPLLFC